MAVTIRAPSSTDRASHGRGSSLTLGKTSAAGEQAMKTFRLVLLFVSAASAGYSRLGDVESDLVARYGKPTTRGHHYIGKREAGPTLYFSYQDWGISCDLADGRCVRIRYISKVAWTEERIQSV